MEQTIKDVFEWLMRNTELLASEAFKAAKMQVIASSLIWLIVGIILTIFFFNLSRKFFSFQVPVILRGWNNKEDGEAASIAVGCVSGILALIFLLTLIPYNFTKLLASDWYAVELLITTIQAIK